MARTRLGRHFYDPHDPYEPPRRTLNIYKIDSTTEKCLRVFCSIPLSRVPEKQGWSQRIVERCGW